MHALRDYMHTKVETDTVEPLLYSSMFFLDLRGFESDMMFCAGKCNGSERCQPQQHVRLSNWRCLFFPGRIVCVCENCRHYLNIQRKAIVDKIIKVGFKWRHTLRSTTESSEPLKHVGIRTAYYAEENSTIVRVQTSAETFQDMGKVDALFFREITPKLELECAGCIQIKLDEPKTIVFLGIEKTILQRLLCSYGYQDLALNICKVKVPSNNAANAYSTDIVKSLGSGYDLLHRLRSARITDSDASVISSVYNSIVCCQDVVDPAAESDRNDVLSAGTSLVTSETTLLHQSTLGPPPPLPPVQTGLLHQSTTLGPPPPLPPVQTGLLHQSTTLGPPPPPAQTGVIDQVCILFEVDSVTCSAHII
jgi:hypothetical protein